MRARNFFRAMLIIDIKVVGNFHTRVGSARPIRIERSYVCTNVPGLVTNSTLSRAVCKQARASALKDTRDKKLDHEQRSLPASPSNHALPPVGARAHTH